MNPLEKIIYDLVKRSPSLKARLVAIYQRLCALMPVERHAALYEIKARPGYFFGYYDKSPWSPDNRLLLAHGYDLPARMPGPGDQARIGYFEGDRFTAVGRTTGWNWQQGAMLQWLGAEGNLIFNAFDGSEHVARVLDQAGKELAVLPAPVAAVSPDGRRAMSYSFSRLRRCAPGYAYANGSRPGDQEAAPEGDGLYAMDIGSGKVEMLFSLAELARYEPEPSMKGALHYLNHGAYSPSGERMVFLHRWQKQGREWTRMISCGPGGEERFVFPTAGMVSHFAWRDDRRILAWARTQRDGDKYHLFSDRAEQWEIIGGDSFNSDGHPSFSPDLRWIVTDTYPDRFRIGYLVLYNLDTRRRYNIAKLRSPFKFNGDVRCDLHPRWDRSGSRVCFDSVHTGARSLCTVELTDLSGLQKGLS